MPTTFYDYKIIVALLFYRLGAVHDASPQATFKQTPARLVDLPNVFLPDELISCVFCKKGRLIKSAEEMKFQQWSRKGYVHCRVMVTVAACDLCGVRSLGPGTDQILDEAFKREYDKLP
jgi:hypothetical protein